MGIAGRRTIPTRRVFISTESERLGGGQAAAVVNIAVVYRDGVVPMVVLRLLVECNN